MYAKKKHKAYERSVFLHFSCRNFACKVLFTDLPFLRRRASTHLQNAVRFIPCPIFLIYVETLLADALVCGQPSGCYTATHKCKLYVTHFQSCSGYALQIPSYLWTFIFFTEECTHDVLVMVPSRKKNKKSTCLLSFLLANYMCKFLFGVKGNIQKNRRSYYEKSYVSEYLYCNSGYGWVCL